MQSDQNKIWTLLKNPHLSVSLSLQRTATLLYEVSPELRRVFIPFLTKCCRKLLSLSHRYSKYEATASSLLA